MYVVKFLIIAGPYEADLIRRAALASDCEALAIEAGDSLSGWVAASRPDAIVVTSRAVKAKVTETISALRRLPGGNVPIVMLCDAGERQDAEALADVSFVRPVAPQAVVDAAKALVVRRRVSQIPPPVTSEVPAIGSGPSSPQDFEKRDSSLSRKAPSESRLRAISSDPTAMPILAPLQVERRRLSSVAPEPTKAAAPLSRRISDSIDQLLDAEMERTLSQVGPAPKLQLREGLEEPTREVPQGFVNTILADARHVLGTASLLPETSINGVGPGRRAGFPAAGELTGTAVHTLLGLALQEGVTGRLRVRHGDTEKSVFFEAGRPVLAVSSAVADRMVQMLIRQGTLSNDQARAAIDVATESGRRMGAVLVDLGFLKSTELLPAVRQHYEDIIFSLFAWIDGSFRFETGATADPRRVRLLRHPAALTFEGVARAYDENRLRLALGKESTTWRLESSLSAPDILLEVSGGDPVLSRIPVLFDGVRSLSEVVRASAQPPQSVLQVAVILRAFGVLSSSRNGDAFPVAADSMSTRDREIDRERINSRLALVQEGDYYQVLGVPQTATIAEIRAIYERLSRDVSDAVLGTELATEMALAISEIRSSISEALSVLTHEPLRSSYTRRLGGQSARARN